MTPKRHILVVDDENDIVKLLKYNLEKEGYQVSVAASGEAGYELARSKNPDLILLDLMLPGMDGLEVCKLLQSEKKTRCIPVLMLTAKNTEVDQVVGLELGAADYLSKPFSVKVLLARIKNIFRSRQAPSEEAVLVQAGQIELDRERHQVRVKDKEVVFTRLEFDLLAFLMENRGKVFSRDKILDGVWKGQAFVVDRSVDAHIKSIRQKLGKYRDLIETVRGSGYRFSEEPADL